MTDFTAVQSLAYDRLLESERGPSQDEIDYQTLQIMRGLSAADISEAIYDLSETIRDHTARKIDPALTGSLVQKAVRDWCESVAKWVVEA